MHNDIKFLTPFCTIDLSVWKLISSYKLTVWKLDTPCVPVFGRYVPQQFSSMRTVMVEGTSYRFPKANIKNEVGWRLHLSKDTLFETEQECDSSAHSCELLLQGILLNANTVDSFKKVDRMLVISQMLDPILKELMQFRDTLIHFQAKRKQTRTDGASTGCVVEAEKTQFGIGQEYSYSSYASDKTNAQNQSDQQDNHFQHDSLSEGNTTDMVDPSKQFSNESNFAKMQLNHFALDGNLYSSNDNTYRYVINGLYTDLEAHQDMSDLLESFFSLPLPSFMQCRSSLKNLLSYLMRFYFLSYADIKHHTFYYNIAVPSFCPYEQTLRISDSVNKVTPITEAQRALIQKYLIQMNSQQTKLGLFGCCALLRRKSNHILLHQSDRDPLSLLLQASRCTSSPLHKFTQPSTTSPVSSSNDDVFNSQELFCLVPLWVLLIVIHQSHRPANAEHLLDFGYTEAIIACINYMESEQQQQCEEKSSTVKKEDECSKVLDFLGAWHVRSFLFALGLFGLNSGDLPVFLEHHLLSAPSQYLHSQPVGIVQMPPEHCFISTDQPNLDLLHQKAGRFTQTFSGSFQSVVSCSQPLSHSLPTQLYEDIISSSTLSQNDTFSVASQKQSSTEDHKDDTVLERSGSQDGVNVATAQKTLRENEVVNEKPKILDISEKSPPEGFDKMNMTDNSAVAVNKPDKPRRQHPYIMNWLRRRTEQGDTTTFVIDTRHHLDPTAVQANSIQLNIQLIQWRMLPQFDPARLQKLKFLLIGVGTLGCAVARNLISWGVKCLTLVDHSCVTYSSPVRQILYSYSDAICLNGHGLLKTVAAKRSLLKIRPDLIINAVPFEVPLPGHEIYINTPYLPVCNTDIADKNKNAVVDCTASSTTETISQPVSNSKQNIKSKEHVETKNNSKLETLNCSSVRTGANSLNETVQFLEYLIDAHDVVFLLTDSRESRWLPSLVAASRDFRPSSISDYSNPPDIPMITNHPTISRSFASVQPDVMGGSESMLKEQYETLNDRESWSYLFHTPPSFSQPLVVTVGLGFDSFVIIRHGQRTASLQHPLLGCYFCNDLDAPTDTVSQRSLDLQCTVTRPGLSSIASGYATELVAAISQHALAPAPDHSSSDFGRNSGNEHSCLGAVPHTIRGNLGSFKITSLSTEALEYCICCSEPICKAYCSNRNEFINTVTYRAQCLEEISGLKQIKDGYRASEILCFNEFE